MDDKGFILTMDTVLAMIPIFIVVAGVTQLTDTQSLYTQSYILGSERVVQDVLESMRIHGDFDNTARDDINATITAILPPDYEFDYSVTDNGTLVTNFSTGTPPLHADVIAGKRSAFINLEKILDQAVAISHGGDSATAEYCDTGDCGANQRVWEMEFAYAPDDYDYYLVFERNDTSTGGFWRVKDTKVPTSQCSANPEKLCNINAGDGQQIFSGNELTSTVKLVKNSTLNSATMTANQKYYVYVRVVANPAAFFDAFVIRAKLGADINDITSQNARIYENAEVTLKIWRE